MDAAGSVGPIGGGQPNMNFMNSFYQFMQPNDGGNIGAPEWEPKDPVSVASSVDFSL
jgi:hypothetical protein